MAHLKLNTAQWLELGEKLGYIKEAKRLTKNLKEWQKMFDSIDPGLTTVEIKIRPGGHVKALLRVKDTGCQFIYFFGVTTSDFRAMKNAKSDVRRLAVTCEPR